MTAKFRVDLDGTEAVSGPLLDRMKRCNVTAHTLCTRFFGKRGSSLHPRALQDEEDSDRFDDDCVVIDDDSAFGVRTRV